ncbi:hypothetical protein KR044_013145, partial [Drosophila immigrans]
EMVLNSMCNFYDDSPDRKHWQDEVCGQCPNWKLDQDQDTHIVNGAHKLMTTEECKRLKRDLRHAFFTNNSEVHFWIFLMLVLFIIFCMALMLWLLAKAFVFSPPPEEDSGQSNSQDRQMGGRSSVDDAMQQLREKCTASTHNVNCKYNDGFYLPASFWDRFPMNEFIHKSKKTDPKLEPGSTTEVGTEADSEKVQTNESNAEGSNNSSSGETIETSFIEELNEDEDVTNPSSNSEATSRSTDDQSEQTSDEESTLKTKDIKRTLSINSLEQMPIFYGQIAANAMPDRSRLKMRWANWLRRSKPVDFEV